MVPQIPLGDTVLRIHGDAGNMDAASWEGAGAPAVKRAPKLRRDKSKPLGGLVEGPGIPPGSVLHLPHLGPYLAHRFEHRLSGDTLPVRGTQPYPHRYRQDSCVLSDSPLGPPSGTATRPAE